MWLNYGTDRDKIFWLSSEKFLLLCLKSAIFEHPFFATYVAKLIWRGTCRRAQTIRNIAAILIQRTTRFFSYKNVYFWSEARRFYFLCLLRLKPCLLCSYFFDRLLYKKAILLYHFYCKWCQYKMEYSKNKMQDEFQKN